MYLNQCGCPNRRREEILDSCCRIPLLINSCLPPLLPDPELSECPCPDGPIVLGGRYYAMIHYPASSPFRQSLKVYIPHAGITEGFMQILLPPSTRGGVNGQYRVEYWKYHPMLNARPKTRIRDELVKRELWSVPFLSPGREASIDLTRSDYLSPLENVDIIEPASLGVRAFDVLSIGSPHWEGATLQYFPFSIPLISYKEKAPPISHVGIGWGQAQPRPGTSYRVSYMRPLSWEDVVVG